VKQSAAIVPDTCWGTSMWIFDQTNLRGNQICFSGTGVTDLTRYGAPCWGPQIGFPLCGNWGSAMSSYWAGDHPGGFQRYDGPWNLFYPYQRVDWSGPEPKTNFWMYTERPPR
jgi:hypothetical protein